MFNFGVKSILSFDRLIEEFFQMNLPNSLHIEDNLRTRLEVRPRGFFGHNVVEFDEQKDGH